MIFRKRSKQRQDSNFSSLLEIFITYALQKHNQEFIILLTYRTNHKLLTKIYKHILDKHLNYNINGNHLLKMKFSTIRRWLELEMEIINSKKLEVLLQETKHKAYLSENIIISNSNLLLKQYIFISYFIFSSCLDIKIIRELKSQYLMLL